MTDLDVIAAVGMACRYPDDDSPAKLLTVYGSERATRPHAPEPQPAAGIHGVQL